MDLMRTIFTDRYGDELQIIPRDRTPGGNPSHDPVISVFIKHENQKHSIVMNDAELDEVLRDMCQAFGYIAFKNDDEVKVLGQVIAYITSGVPAAVPEEIDYERARALIKWLEKKIKNDDLVYPQEGFTD